MTINIRDPRYEKVGAQRSEIYDISEDVYYVQYDLWIEDGPWCWQRLLKDDITDLVSEGYEVDQWIWSEMMTILDEWLDGVRTETPTCLPG